jgi:diguanylate cyclase (GGDEF)-like protein
VRPALIEACDPCFRHVRRLLTYHGGQVLRPVLLGGFANALLFFAVARSHPWTIAGAALAAGILGTVLARQVGQLLSLERQAGRQAHQLSTITEIVSCLNSSTSVGSALGGALEKLLSALDADGGAVWVPSAAGSGDLVLVEQRGLPNPDGAPEILAKLQGLMSSPPTYLLPHTLEVPGSGFQQPPAQCLSVRLGREGEEFGYLCVLKWEGHFSETEAAIVGAVASDIGAALRSIRLISDARRLADRDPVTALLNHRSAYQRIHVEIEQHARARKPLAVILMDLDNFKLFNDTYGHPAGDEVLKRVAAILRRSCRDEDTVARYGADEFLLIMPETSLKQAVKCAERIQASLARERFRCENSAPLPLGFSYGIAVYPEDSLDVLELVSIADANLYHSKCQGGNQITARGTNKTDSSLIYVKGFDLFRAMVHAIDNKDGYTRQHSEEVTQYSLEIARAMELGEEMLQTIQLAGILHDVGKIGVPDSVLRKPGKLTDEEYEVMQQHPVFGALIVGALPGMEQVVLGVRHHHERYDGRGYPDRLTGEEIPVIGRIMAVADAYSAMTTTRPYRKGLTERQALLEIERGLGTQFDPRIGALFIRIRQAQPDETPKTPRRTRKVKTPGDRTETVAVEA